MFTPTGRVCGRFLPTVASAITNDKESIMGRRDMGPASWLWLAVIAAALWVHGGRAAEDAKASFPAKVAELEASAKTDQEKYDRSLDELVATDMDGALRYLLDSKPGTMNSGTRHGVNMPTNVDCALAASFLKRATEKQREQLLLGIIESPNYATRLSFPYLFSSSSFSEPARTDIEIANFCREYLDKHTVNNDVAFSLFSFLLGGHKFDYQSANSPLGKWIKNLANTRNDIYAYYANQIIAVHCPLTPELSTRILQAMRPGDQKSYAEIGTVWGVWWRLGGNMFAMRNKDKIDASRALSADILSEITKVVADSPDWLFNIVTPSMEADPAMETNPGPWIVGYLGLLQHGTPDGKKLIHYFVQKAQLHQVMQLIRENSSFIPPDEFNAYCTRVCQRLANKEYTDLMTLGCAIAFAKCYLQHPKLSDADKAANRRLLEQALGLAPAEKTDK